MDAPRAGPPVPVVALVPVVGAAVEVVAGPEVAVDVAPVPAAVVVADVLGACVVVVPAGLLNRLGAAASGCVVEVSAGFEVPRPLNKPPGGAAAGVDEGVADDDAPPSPANRGFCGVADDAAVWLFVLPASEGKAGFDAASVPEDGAEKSEEV